MSVFSVKVWLIFMALWCVYDAGKSVYNIYLFPLFETEQDIPEKLKPLVDELSENTGILKIMINIDNETSSMYGASESHTYLGPQITISRIMLNDFNDDELLAVMYHEIGHYVSNDGVFLLVILIVPNLITAGFVLWILIKIKPITLRFRDASIIAIVPLLILFGVTFIFNIIQITYWHQAEIEYNADHYSVQFGASRAAVGAFTKYLVIDHKEIETSFLEELWDFLVGGNYEFVEQVFGPTHPPITERIMRFSECSWGN